MEKIGFILVLSIDTRGILYSTSHRSSRNVSRYMVLALALIDSRIRTAVIADEIFAAAFNPERSKADEVDGSRSRHQCAKM